MHLKGNIADIFEEAALELRAVSESGATLIPVIDVCEGQEMITILISMNDGAEFRTYSSASTASLRAYAKGFLHGLRLVSGDYAFKPNNELAARKKRESICPWKEEAKKYRLQTAMDLIKAPDHSFGKQVVAALADLAKDTTPGAKARLSPRYTLWRNRFRED